MIDSSSEPMREVNNRVDGLEDRYDSQIRQLNQKLDRLEKRLM